MNNYDNFTNELSRSSKSMDVSKILQAINETKKNRPPTSDKRTVPSGTLVPTAKVTHLFVTENNRCQKMTGVKNALT